ncbi:MAG TPA: phosphotransferase, partial [Thermoleophilaceae bacterium]|nr:phosphotransferase [Thermoleophilaceae bacterium]
TAPGASSPIRFVAGSWRVEERRPAVVLRGLAARLGGPEVYLAWPDVHAPRQIVPAGRPEVAAWVRDTFEPLARRRLDAATWSTLRSRSLVIARGPGTALTAAENALGRSLDGAALGCMSDSGHVLAKLLCFVFERGEREPSVVAKAIPKETEGERLLEEVRVTASIRDRLSSDVAAALPENPFWTGRVGADDFVVELPDPLAGATGREDRGLALGWLRRFHEETAHERWGTEADLTEADEMLDFAAEQAGIADRAALRASWRALWSESAGDQLPRCAVHGDFWRGNIAVDGTRLRVYDWEWTAPSGHPLLDLWSYELGELRGRAGSPGGIEPELRAALRRVEAELEERGLDHRLALALLLPVTAEVGYRVRRRRGTPPDHEDRPRALLRAAAALVGGR